VKGGREGGLRDCWGGGRVGGGRVDDGWWMVDDGCWMMDDGKLIYQHAYTHTFSLSLSKFFSQTPKALPYLKRNHLSRSKTLTLTLWTLDEDKSWLGGFFLVCSCDVCFFIVFIVLQFGVVWFGGGAAVGWLFGGWVRMGMGVGMEGV